MAILQVEKGVQKKVVADNLGILASTLSTWLKTKDTTKAAYESGAFGGKAKRMKPGQYPKMETALVAWMLTCLRLVPFSRVSLTLDLAVPLAC